MFVKFSGSKVFHKVKYCPFILPRELSVDSYVSQKWLNAHLRISCCCGVYSNLRFTVDILYRNFMDVERYIENQWEMHLRMCKNCEKYISPNDKADIV
jgi:hypothetical protein